MIGSFPVSHWFQLKTSTFNPPEKASVFPNVPRINATRNSWQRNISLSSMANPSNVEELGQQLQSVTIADVAASQPGTNIAFEIRPEEGPPGGNSERTYDEDASETFYGGEIIPNMTFTGHSHQCGPNCGADCASRKLMEAALPGTHFIHVEPTGISGDFILHLSDDAIEVRSSKQLVTEPKSQELPPSSSLCELCSNLDFTLLKLSQPLDHYEYPKLQSSAKQCSLCAVLLASIPNLESFRPSESGKCLLKAVRNHDQNAISKIQLRAPGEKIKAAENDPQNIKSITICSELDIFVDGGEYILAKEELS
jgi:hypothetical protein